MLRVENLETGYGDSQVLFDVSFDIAAGEILGMVGRNGMGKSTTLRSIAGLTPPWRGSIMFEGAELSGRKPYRIARAGVALVPEGRRIFSTLSVRENLIAARLPAPTTTTDDSSWDLDRVLGLFPRLGERLHNMGNQLSGGEQQMLAIGRSLMMNPRLLMLDEAFEGLAPSVRDEIWQAVHALGKTGQAILLVDSHVDRIAEFADRLLIMELGHLVWQGTSTEFNADAEALKSAYLAV